MQPLPCGFCPARRPRRAPGGGATGESAFQEGAKPTTRHAGTAAITAADEHGPAPIA
jgi:hypothetical protein